MKRMAAVVPALVLAMGLAMPALVACGRTGGAASASSSSSTVTVNASAEVSVVPDKASFTVELLAEGETAEEAQKAGKEPNDAVLAALKKAGVEEKSIQTSYTGVSPTYDWSSGTQSIVGYEWRATLTVSDVDIDAVASVMEACVAAGATGVYGPNYYASTYDEAYEQALVEAIDAAHNKATVMAKAAGAQVGDVVSIDEGYQNTGYRYEEATMAAADSADAGAGAAKIAPGEVDITAEVTVSYELV